VTDNVTANSSDKNFLLSIMLNFQLQIKQIIPLLLQHNINKLFFLFRIC